VFFDGEDLENESYPVEYYIEFLEYINRNYKDRYWHGFPKEIVGLWKDNS
jgi:hypothetical protein